MELLPMRDLIQDDLGNYYIISKMEGSKLTLVNAAVYYSFNRILDNEFVEEINKEYKKPVAVGQSFTDTIKYRIEGLSSGKFPGGIYNLNEVAKEYEIEVDGLYERDVVLK